MFSSLAEFSIAAELGATRRSLPCTAPAATEASSVHVAISNGLAFGIRWGVTFTQRSRNFTRGHGKFKRSTSEVTNSRECTRSACGGQSTRTSEDRTLVADCAELGQAGVSFSKYLEAVCFQRVAR
mmetsp:Transcript_82668/g.145883  ORF Transcript_82668/g.145883 Transcript_82668/m.145883 type:complete len:126 (-) Transcript_82668:373-750(-)